MALIKDVSANNDPGDATRWGGNDIMKMDNLFNDVDISPLVPKVNTIVKWRDQKFHIYNPARTFDYIFQSSAILADRKVILPLLTADDTLMFNNFPAVIENKTLGSTTVFPATIAKTDNVQTFTDFKSFDKQIRMKLQTVYDTPPSSYVGLYFDNDDGWLRKKDSAGLTSTAAAGILYPDNNQRFGFISPSASAAGAPQYSGVLAVPTEVGTRTQGSDNTNGHFIDWVSGSGLNDDAGIRFDAIVSYGTFNPVVLIRFRLADEDTNTKAYMGWTSDVSAFPTGNDHLNAKSGFMLYKTDGGNFRIGRNDGTGATVFSSDIATADQNTHTIILRCISSVPKWSYSWDGAAFVDFTTDIPAITTGLGFVSCIENGVAAARKIRVSIIKYASAK